MSDSSSTGITASSERPPRPSGPSDAVDVVGAANVVRLPLTVIIPTLDEVLNIGDCIASARMADQVVVADAGSTDGTIEAARAAGATVLEGTGPTIAAQRNAAIAVARNRWVFALDADERMTPSLGREIEAILSGPLHAAYRVRRQNFYLGVEQHRGSWARDWVTRLFPRERRYVEQRVHEGLEPVPDTGSLVTRLVHRPYRSLAHQIEKLHRYAEWGAADLWDKGHRTGWADLTLRPAGRFLKSYLLAGAILEGRRGVVKSGLDAYEGFLKYAYLWEMERKDRGLGAGGES